MSSISVTLPNGAAQSFPRGTTPLQVAAKLGKRLADDALAAKVDGNWTDIYTPIEKDCSVAIVTRQGADGLEVLRHSTAHLLAQAVKELYPQALITIGPVIENGFYYDIAFPTPITADDLPSIEKRMTEIAARGLEVRRQELTRPQAVSLFKGLGEKYKVELIESFPESESVSAYKQGDFTDLCRGPHVPNTAKLGKFKLLSLAGAYWRGNENNAMLTRIYGTAFPTQKELDDHLALLEEAKRRDHRKLGPEMELFSFLPVAPAMPFYLPRGTALFHLLADFMRKETERLGYCEVICPQLMNLELWKTSGHLENYRDNMFLIEEPDGTGVGLKPMNCPGHAALYRTTLHSYRDLPLRMSEFTRLHRNERAGVTHGILRTRAFSQDDAHIFCTEDQIEGEAKSMVDLIYRVYRQFGFEKIAVKLATRPAQFMGAAEKWDRATLQLENSLKAASVPYEYAHGEGAFYSPKIEFHIRDSLGRDWQCGTVQLDFNLPERFQLEYVDKDNKTHRPVMIHRAVLGSIERFMGILIEHYGGHFPLWIAPVQTRVISVTEEQTDYAQSVFGKLKGLGLRTEIDLSHEKLGYKIRQAQLLRVPLMIILGSKEVESSTLSVRKANGENLNNLSFDAFEKFLEPLLKPGG